MLPSPTHPSPLRPVSNAFYSHALKSHTIPASPPTISSSCRERVTPQLTIPIMPGRVKSACALLLPRPSASLLKGTCKGRSHTLPQVHDPGAQEQELHVQLELPQPPMLTCCGVWCGVVGS